MYDIFNSLFNLIFGPILLFLDDLFVDKFGGSSLMGYTFKIGFGNVEWFSIDLYTLFGLIGGLIISVVFIILIFKVFKFFTNLVKRAFGGKKW